jgi:hypothetical protein
MANSRRGIPHEGQARGERSALAGDLKRILQTKASAVPSHRDHSIAVRPTKRFAARKRKDYEKLFPSYQKAIKSLEVNGTQTAEQSAIPGRSFSSVFVAPFRLPFRKASWQNVYLIFLF